MKARSGLLSAIMAAALTIGAAMSASAQEWPVRPIKIVVPLAPGAAADLVARAVGDEIAARLKQPFVIENRPGGGGAITAEFVARSKPDGYTLLLGTTGTNGTAFHLLKKLSYDPIKDFTPLTNAVEIPIALVVHRSLPTTTVGEFIAYAKQNPGKISFGSSGHGTSLHLSGELLKSRAGIDMQHVSYRGGAPAMNDLVAGTIPTLFATLSTALPQLASGNVRILATTGSTRSRARPDLPTIAETVPDYTMPPTWVGFLGPAGMPEELAARINAELVQAINAPRVRKLLEDNGFEVTPGPSAEFAAMLRVSLDRFGKIVADAGMTPK